MNDEQDSQLAERLPYLHEKIPVVNGASEFQAFMERYPGFTFCAYLADKPVDKIDEGWAISTSRVYMNQVLPGFMYVPVNVPKGDHAGLTELFEAVANDPRVVAVNITQPHKSNAVVKAMFAGDEVSEANIDTLIRGSDGAFHPYDRDAPAFMDWYRHDVGAFTGKNVVMVGAGGAGEPIAKLIAAQAPARMILVDPSDKSALATRLNEHAPTDYYTSLASVSPDTLGSNLVVINAAGKQGVDAGSGLASMLSRFAEPGNVFVDIRPQLDLEIVKVADELGWNAHTGHGMNAWNDYVLVCAIAEQMGVEPLSFDEFRAKVAKAS